MPPALAPCADPAVPSSLRMNPGIGHFCQPRSNMRVGRFDIELQTSRLQAGCQRNKKASFEVAVEAFDFSFGLGPILSTNTWRKAVILGHVDQAGMPINSTCSGTPPK
jgi:hypothetical protein